MPSAAAEIATVPPGSAIWVAIGLLTGCFTFYIGDLAITRMGGGDRKSADGVEKPNSALAIVLGAGALILWRRRVSS